MSLSDNNGRQLVPQAVPSVSRTVSSYDANSVTGPAALFYNDSSAAFAEPLERPPIVNLDSCTEVRIGENVTQIYNNGITHGTSKLMLSFRKNAD